MPASIRAITPVFRMRALRRLEGGQLLRSGLLLVLRLPLRERLAVDRFARLVPGHGDAARFGGFAVPVRQAVAAEAGEDHQVDVLHVRSFLHQVLQQPAESGGFDGGGFGIEVVHMASPELLVIPANAGIHFDLALLPEPKPLALFVTGPAVESRAMAASSLKVDSSFRWDDGTGRMRA